MALVLQKATVPQVCTEELSVCWRGEMRGDAHSLMHVEMIAAAHEIPVTVICA